MPSRSSRAGRLRARELCSGQLALPPDDLSVPRAVPPPLAALSLLPRRIDRRLSDAAHPLARKLCHALALAHLDDVLRIPVVRVPRHARRAVARRRDDTQLGEALVGGRGGGGGGGGRRGRASEREGEEQVVGEEEGVCARGEGVEVDDEDARGVARDVDVEGICSAGLWRSACGERSERPSERAREDAQLDTGARALTSSSQKRKMRRRRSSCVSGT